jgi:hypothetical protein
VKNIGRSKMTTTTYSEYWHTSVNRLNKLTSEAVDGTLKLVEASLAQCTDQEAVQFYINATKKPLSEYNESVKDPQSALVAMATKKYNEVKVKYTEEEFELMIMLAKL